MLEDLETFLQLLVRDDERHQCADHVSVGPCGNQDQPVLPGLPKDAIRPLFVWLFRAAVFDDLERPHRSQSTRFSDEWEAVIETAETLFDLPADLGRAVA